MNSSPARQSAQILAFPTAKRTAAVILSKKAKFAAEVAALRAQPIVSTDAWYHQAAIDETSRKN